MEREALYRRAGGATRERMLRELAEAVEALTTTRPLVLVLEDLHWSDDATLDWLVYMARRREPADRTEKLEPELAAVLAEVEAGATGPDAVARGSGLDADAAGAALVQLELQGLVRCDSAGRFRPAVDTARL